MTRDILVYVLDCGCTDWCTCTQCALTQPHTPGTGWRCDEHGPTNVKNYIEVPELKVPVEDGSLVMVGSGDSFTLAAGHPMRAARCAVCSLPVDGNPVTLVSLAALGGPGCDCGLVPASTYLIHANHLSMTPEQIMEHIETALLCPHDHPWTDQQ